jgi:endonuclease G, mitochondrial
LNRWLSGLLVGLLIAFIVYTYRQDHPVERAIVPTSYGHDRYGTQPIDQRRDFEAFISSFDGPDDNNGDGLADTLGIPQWVAYQINRHTDPIQSSKRPRSWSTDKPLAAAGLAPKDKTYRYSKTFRAAHPNWYVRGHLAMKYHAERLSAKAAKQTHTLLNAVPQRAQFNSGIWLDLECRTGAWANQYGAVWVVAGPVFYEISPKAWIGEREKGERLAAVPNALFKVVIKESGDPQQPDVLGFVYPQEDEVYRRGPYPHERFLVSVDYIEKLTGLDFLTTLDKEDQASIEAGRPRELWSVEGRFFTEGCKRSRGYAEIR